MGYIGGSPTTIFSRIYKSDNLPPMTVTKKVKESRQWQEAVLDSFEYEAIEQFKVEKPDLILLDIIMPKMDGVAVLDSLKKINSDANVIMITAVGQEQIMEECQKLGAKGYIVKPFDEKQVLEEVKKVLS